MINDYIAMGGYGGYIWSAYSLSMLVIASLYYVCYQDHQKSRKLLIKGS